MIILLITGYCLQSITASANTECSLHVATFKKQGSGSVIVEPSQLELSNKRAAQKGSSYSNFINNVFCNWLETFG